LGRSLSLSAIISGVLFGFCDSITTKFYPWCDYHLAWKVTITNSITNCQNKY